jgi:hypothetical protein
MSVSFQIAINDTATPRLQQLAENLTAERLGALIGPAVNRLTKDHIVMLPGNKRGWPRTNFWAQAARATNWRTTPDGCVVSVNKTGMRQRYHGGPIRPVNKRALTIPISPEAYGKTASHFPNAFLITTSKGAYLVQRGYRISTKTGKPTKATGRGYARKRVVADIEFLFKLSYGVTQKHDPTVLPSTGAYSDTATDALANAFEKGRL